MILIQLGSLTIAKCYAIVYENCFLFYAGIIVVTVLVRQPALEPWLVDSVNGKMLQAG